MLIRRRFIFQLQLALVVFSAPFEKKAHLTFRMAAQVEAACIAFYGQGQQQAQDILLAFQASNSALPDAFHLLWHSSVSWAQFHGNKKDFI